MAVWSNEVRDLITNQEHCVCLLIATMCCIIVGLSSKAVSTNWNSLHPCWESPFCLIKMPLLDSNVSHSVGDCYCAEVFVWLNGVRTKL